MTRSLFACFLLLPLLYSCDPALRLEIINHSSIPQTMIVDSVHCAPLSYFLRERTDSLRRERFIIPVGKNHKEVFYFGIGTWSEQAALDIVGCLDSLFGIYPNSGDSEQTFRSTAKTHEFGNSLLTYEIFDLQPPR